MMTMGINHEINTVLNGKGGKATKVRTLVEKVGITTNEANMLFKMWRLNNPVEPRSTFAYTFGVEIECGVDRSTFVDFSRQFGVRVNYEGYNHIDHRDGRTFKMVSDSSVHIANSIECVSPVLDGKAAGFKTLENAVKALNASGARVDRTCGLHVHIGVADMTDEQYVNVFRNYAALENVIDTFMARSRRGNDCGWCYSLTRYNFGDCFNPSDVCSKLHGNRYFKVNPCSWSRHRTIEFRQHQGTTDYKKISYWAKFCAKLVEYSRNNVITSCGSIDEIPFLTKTEKTFFKSRKNTLAA